MGPDVIYAGEPAHLYPRWKLHVFQGRREQCEVFLVSTFIIVLTRVAGAIFA